MNKLFRFYSMFIKWYSVVIKCLFNVYYKCLLNVGFPLIVNDYLGFFRDSNSQLFGDYSIYLLGINDYLDDYLGKKK